MMNSKYYILCVMSLSLFLSACSDDHHDEEVSLFSQVASLNADDEPAAITKELKEDVRDIFGKADSVVTNVLIDDTVEDIIERARSIERDIN